MAVTIRGERYIPIRATACRLWVGYCQTRSKVAFDCGQTSEGQVTYFAGGKSTHGEGFGDSWSGCKVGSWARYKMKGTVGTRAVDSEATFKLIEFTAEKAVIEIRPRSVVGGKTVDMPPEKEVFKAKDMPAGRLEDRGEEEIEVAGKKLKCSVVDRVTEIGDAKLRTRFWYCDEVPGRLVKSEVYDKNDKPTIRSTLLAWEKKEKK